MLVYKIFRAEERRAFLAAGPEGWQGSADDLRDGFVHLSDADQAPRSAKRFFEGEHGLILGAYDADRLGGDLKWEVAHPGLPPFPHLYRPLRREDEVWSAPLPLGQDGHDFPPLPG